jgi:hypothetical protein
LPARPKPRGRDRTLLGTWRACTHSPPRR